jgi:hypothetical protein
VYSILPFLTQQYINTAIKHKISVHIFGKADKGNSLVIIYLDDYHKKVHELISNKSFSKVNNDLISTFQKEIRNTINDCLLTFHKDEKGKYINLNTSAPTIGGMPKIHKIDVHFATILLHNGIVSVKFTPVFSLKFIG